MRLAKLADELEQARHDAARADIEAEELAELSKRDRQRDAVHESSEYGTRQKVGKRAEPEKAGPHADKTCKQRKRHRHCHVLLRVPSGERRNCGRDECAGCGVRAYDELSRRAKYGVSDKR